MNPLGEIKFYFSERLKSIDDLDLLNLTMISNDAFFKVQYKTYVGSDYTEEEAKQ